MRRLMIILPVLLATGCAGTPGVPVEIPGEAASPPPAISATVFGHPAASGFYSPDAGMTGDVVAQGTFDPKDGTAITYEPQLVPAGSTAHVTVTRLANGMQVRLAVTGMLPLRTYGAHLHTKPCRPDPKGAGPHYQHNPDPMASASPPPADPSYANPKNEVWLDFTADRIGAATATAVLTWSFDELTPPRSLVVHASRTRTEEGFAGTAGARVACLTLPG
ncbi:superoxide dismutase family protein [Actinoplanes sp. NPDC049265]|uniref:superoxide dismutase family protein n=1 Tax=Actinoplanes sp. NPDC049265 TaxID=3363902 RepID=UPI003721127D